MIFYQLKIKGVYGIEPELKKDSRGYFTRIFALVELRKVGISFQIVHINRSLTLKKGTIRGMHFQKDPYAEDKIVHCIKGAVYDVATDLRRNSPTFGKWVSEELSEDNKKMLFIPKGFAHGFQTLTSNCEMLYFMSQSFSPNHASGVRWNDPLLKISWPIKNPLLSEKDKNWSLITI